MVNKGRVSYSDPTFTAIRSGKQDHSSALAHARDFHTLTQLPAFEEAALTEDTLKPVVIISAEGGPDETRDIRKPFKQQSKCSKCMVWMLFSWQLMPLVVLCFQ